MSLPTPATTKSPFRPGTTYRSFLEKVRRFSTWHPFRYIKPGVLGILFVEGAQHRQQVGIRFHPCLVGAHEFLV